MEGGFEQPEFTQVAQIWRFPSPHEFFKAFHEGTPRTGALPRAQHSEVLETIRMLSWKRPVLMKRKALLKSECPPFWACAIKPQ